MSEALRVLLVSFAACQALSLAALYFGSRLIGREPFARVGRLAEERKIRALETLWPLTRLRPAVSRGDRRTVVGILGALIALKSLLCLPFGLIMVFWLPPASLLVPSIVAAHDPDDPELRMWARRVATLQVTSHALAASVGFSVAYLGPVAEGQFRAAALADVVQADAVLFVSAFLLSLVFARWAGHVEADGVFRFGV